MILDTPSATELLLDILSLVKKSTLTASQIRVAGEAFGFSAVTMRAAASRLSDRGYLVTIERGVYSASSNVTAAHRFIRNWHNVLEEVEDWRQNWYVALAPNTPNAKRSATRNSEKLLVRYGFKRWRTQLFVRPANLVGGIEGMRSRIKSWQNGPLITLTTLSDVDQSLEMQLLDLWQDDLPDYALLASHLEDSRCRIHTISVAEAAVETLSFGRHVVKTILADPRLPEPHAERKGLSQLLDAMRAYERAGQGVWMKYLEIDE